MLAEGTKVQGTYYGKQYQGEIINTRYSTTYKANEHVITLNTPIIMWGEERNEIIVYDNETSCTVKAS